MQYDFQTIDQPIENVLLKEKGSRFIGYAYPVQSEEELKKNLAHLRSEHPKATHHCYAFRIGLNGEHYRANDDGEPSGSAGLPIYNQLLAHGLTNILVVVVRYYGGTKLGVSGLVKAYKDSAKETLTQGKIITSELETMVELEFGFNQQNSVFTLLNRIGAKIFEFVTDENCRIQASVKLSQKESISEQLSEMNHISFNFSD
ncbi:MAG: YigZ family protein [Weeksellaceae bacterium]|nr:YigZ family protein [Weeksellaceae bacterium]